MKFKATLDQKNVIYFSCSCQTTVREACQMVANFFDITFQLQASCYGIELPLDSFLFENIIESDIVYFYQHTKDLIPLVNSKITFLSSIPENHFKVFATLSQKLMLIGEDVELDLNSNYDKTKEILRNHFQNRIPKNYDFIIFLTGGIPFLRLNQNNNEMTLNDFMKGFNNTQARYIYLVFYRKNSRQKIENTLTQIFVPSTSLKDPFYEYCFEYSTKEAASYAASSICYFREDSLGKEDIFNFLCKYIHFPPLLVSLYQLKGGFVMYRYHIIAIINSLFAVLKFFLIPDNAKPLIQEKEIWKCLPMLCSYFSSKSVETHDKFSIISQVFKFSDFFDKYSEDLKYSSILVSDFDDYPKVVCNLEFPVDKEKMLNFLHSSYEKSLVMKIYYLDEMLNLFKTYSKTPRLYYGKNGNVNLFIGMNDHSVQFYDPMVQCTAQNPQSIIQSMTIQAFIDDLRKNKKFVSGSVSELLLIVLDIGCAMGSNNALDNCQTIIKQLLLHYKNDRINARFGVLHFDNYIRKSTELPNYDSDFINRNFIHNATRSDYKSDLNKALPEAYKRMKKFKNQYPAAKFARIIVFSCGIPTEAPKNGRKIIEIPDGVIFDTFYLKTNQDFKFSPDLKYLAHVTGGFYSQVDNINDLYKVIESEPFYHMSLRKFGCTLTLKPFLQYVWNQSSNETSDKEVPFLLPKRCLSQIPLQSARRCVEFIEQHNDLKKALVNTCMPLLKNLYIVAATRNVCYKVYVNPYFFNEWRVLLKGPPKTNYANLWYYLFITFPEQFPYLPPNIRFITPIYHINITEEGGFTHGFINKIFKKDETVDDLLMNIYEVLRKPNENLKFAATKERKEMFMNHKFEYYTKVANYNNMKPSSESEPDLRPKSDPKQWKNMMVIEKIPKYKMTKDISSYLRIPKIFYSHDSDRKIFMKSPLYLPSQQEYYEKTHLIQLKLNSGDHLKIPDSELLLPIDHDMNFMIKIWLLKTGQSQI